MENLKSWLLIVCVFSVVVSIYKIFIPSGNTKKAGMTALSVILIFVMIYPIVGEKGKLKLNNDFLDGDAFSETSFDSQNVAYRQAIKKSINDALLQKNITAENVSFDMNKTADDYIEISNVCLSVSVSELSDSEIIEAVANYTGFSPEIITVKRY